MTERILLGLVAVWVGWSAAASQPPPNMVVILADDMGWNDTGFTGNRHTDTPHLDRMARQGLVFTQACASAPNCSPTRACLLTGQYPPRHGVYTVVDERHRPGSTHHKILAAESREALPTESLTLAEALKPAGYATGLFGMWNLGRGREGPTTPRGQGFDVFIEPKQLGFEKDAYRKADGGYVSDALTDTALKWMEQVKDRPFLLYLPFHDVHAPYDPKPELLAKYRARPGVPDPAQSATVEAMDANVGRVLAALDRLGLKDRTFVLFTSDNGGTRQYVAPLRGGKGTLYQGGLRVPLVVLGPGIEPGTDASTVITMDLFPTILALAGLPLPSDRTVDGMNLAPRLLRGTALPARDVFWHFPCYVGGSGPASAVRSGDWKLIEFFESGSVELYQLKDDPGEQRNVAVSEPEQADRLLGKLHAWQEALQAPRPTQPNPKYDPAATSRAGGGGRKAARPPSPKTIP